MPQDKSLHEMLFGTSARLERVTVNGAADGGSVLTGGFQMNLQPWPGLSLFGPLLSTGKLWQK